MTLREAPDARASEHIIDQVYTTAALGVAELNERWRWTLQGLREAFELCDDHIRLYSSISTRIFSTCPPWVRSMTKSQLQT